MENINEAAMTLVEWSQRSLIPSKWEGSVRILDITESAEAGRSLAHSFATDPLSQYILDCEDMADCSDEQKWKLHVDIMTYVVVANCYKGFVTAIGPDYDALALWLPPGETVDDWWTILRSGMWRLYYQLSPEARRRYYDEMVPVLHNAKQQAMGGRDDDCYYLLYLGTKPNSRGKGYAGKLIRDMITKADAENRPIYLESSSLTNNAYYARFGFELKGDIDFERGRVPVKLYSMVREPQPSKPAYTAPVMFQVGGRVKV